MAIARTMGAGSLVDDACAVTLDFLSLTGDTAEEGDAEHYDHHDMPRHKRSRSTSLPRNAKPGLASMSSSGARQTTCQRKRVCKPPLDGCLDEEVNPL